MKKLFFLGACLVALASQPVKAQLQSTAPDMVIMKGRGMTQPSGADVVVVRVGDGTNASQLIIVRGPGKNEVVDLITSTNTKALISSGEAIQQAIAGLYREGYSLKSTFSGYQGSVSTLIFVKEK
jgi:hypothetical protein